MDKYTITENGRFYGWNYLYGISPEGITSREEYERYVVFMKTITDMLNDFGIRISNNGYSFIIDAVMIIFDRRCLDLRLNNDVYPYIAYKYNYRNGSVIEHNIRNAINSAYVDNQKNPGSNRMAIFRKRPTNKEFLFYVTDGVCHKMSEAVLPPAC